MKLFFLTIKIAAIACIATLATVQASACQCGARNYYGKSSWEAAKLEAGQSTAVFEGTPERFEFQWDALTAKDGELISAENPAGRAWWFMLLTFRVQRGYKGDLGPSIQIRTGLGREYFFANYAAGMEFFTFSLHAAVAKLAMTK